MWLSRDMVGSAQTTETRAALAALPIPLLRAWERGAIRLRWTRDGVTASGFRDDQAGWDE